MALSTIDGSLIGGKILPGGDTASGDDAAIGVTAAEGLILTGQGSTNDVTIKNDADADVIEIPTGTTNVTVAGTLGSGGVITSGAGLVIANGGNIGSVGDADAISIASNGVVTFSQTPVGDNAGTVVQVKSVEKKVIQVSTTTMPYDDTIPQKTEGAEIFTLAITPTSSSNKLHIHVFGMVAAAAVHSVTLALFQDGTANALAAQGGLESNAGEAHSMSFVHVMAAGTTSETIFKVRVGAHSGNAAINGLGNGTQRLGGAATTGMIISEIAV